MSELVTNDPETLLELDARQSGEVYYQLVLHLGSGCIALISRQFEEVRAVPVPIDKGNDAMAHPEAYLASPNVIYPGAFNDHESRQLRMVDYGPDAS